MRSFFRQLSNTDSVVQVVASCLERDGAGSGDIRAVTKRRRTFPAESLRDACSFLKLRCELHSESAIQTEPRAPRKKRVHFP